MPNDATIRWGISGDQAVAAGNDRIARSVDKIASSERSAERAAKGRVRAQHGGAITAGGAHSGAGAFAHAIHAGGGRGFGGHLGHGLGQIASLSGPMMAVGGAALAASVAIHAMEGASDRAVKAAMEEIRARHELTEKIKSSVRAADASAVGTYKSNEEALRSLAGMKNGDQMVERGKLWAQSDGPDAIKAFAMLAARGMEGQMSTASAAAGTGQIGLLDAAKTMTGGKISLSGGQNQVAAAILSEHLNRGVSEGDVAGMRANYIRSGLGNRISAYDANEGNTAAGAIGRFQTSDTLYAHQREERDKIIHPESEARRETTEAINAKLAEIAAGSRAEWAVVGLLKDMVRLLGGGEGSMATKYEETSRLLPTD
jgi:hypothetical protein